MEISRNKSQEIAMSLIYNTLTYTHMGLEFDVEQMISNYLQTPYFDVDIFIKEVVIKSLVYRDVLIAEIQANMTDWKFDRINRLGQAILLLTMTHFRYVEEIDRKILIDIAVKLAKKFLDDGDYKFINAVLEKTL